MHFFRLGVVSMIIVLFPCTYANATENYIDKWNNFKMGDTSDLQEKIDKFKENDKFELTQDFFKEAGFDPEFQALFDNGLDEASQRFEFSLNSGSYTDELENADYSFQDNSSYFAAYCGEEKKDITLHIIIANSDRQIQQSEDDSAIEFSDNEGNVFLSVKIADDNTNSKTDDDSVFKTKGNELCIWNDGYLSTAEPDKSNDELDKAGIEAVFNAGRPFFWNDTTDAEDVEEAEDGEEAEPADGEKGDDKNSDTEKDVHSETVYGAIGMVKPGEYYLYSSKEGLPFDDVGTAMASYGCIYATSIQFSEISLNKECIFPD